MATKAVTQRGNPAKMLTLSIFLLKDGTVERDALDTEACARAQEFPVSLDDKPVGTLWVKQTPDHRPLWARFFDGSIELNKRDLRAASVSAVFLVRASSRLFALSFGHGRHLVNHSAVEERFGLHATLNSVDPEALRGVDTTTLDANPLHGRRQLARAAPLGQFGLNIDQDVLRAVTGTPIDEALGSVMAGRDSLMVRVQTDLSRLRKLLSRYLEKSREETYKKNGFGWVDHVSEVRDPNLQQKLFSAVVEGLGGGGDEVWAAIPEVVDWTTFDSFRFGTPNSGHDRDDVTLEHILDALDAEVPTLELLRRKRVYCMSRGSAHPVMDWTFLKCLSAEIAHDGARYLLNAGTWFRIDPEFASRVADDLKEIQTSTHQFLDWGDETEATYNERMARRSDGNLALMDRVMVGHRGMASSIEFCDLFSQAGEMIHVKRYGQSSVLSHLFAQGTVSAETALSDAAFRKAANEKLPPTHRFADPDARIDASKHEVCFAIGSTRAGRLRLPFFSQVSLRNAYRRLHSTLGFRVSLAKISVSKLNQISESPKAQPDIRRSRSPVPTRARTIR